MCRRTFCVAGLLAATLLGGTANAAGTRVYVRAGDHTEHPARVVSKGVQDRDGPINGPATTSYSVSYVDLTSTSPLDSSTSAYADLTTGKLGITEQDRTLGSESYAEAIFQDHLTFNIAGASPTTVTPIHVLFDLHGTFSYVPNYGLGTVQSNVRLGNAVLQGDYGYYVGAPAPYFSGGAFASATFTQKVDGYHFDGIYFLQGARSEADLVARLSIGADGFASASYGNTAAFHFMLPDEVTFTSQSGSFLTSTGVPEPASWAMLLAGFAGVGATLRRNRAAKVSFA